MEACVFVESKNNKQVFKGIALLPGKVKESDIITQLRNKKVDFVPVRYQGDNMILDFEGALK